MMRFPGHKPGLFLENRVFYEAMIYSENRVDKKSQRRQINEKDIDNLIAFSLMVN